MELGFIGLGLMGRPMAARLLAAGHMVHLHSRSGVPQALVDKGGLPCASACEVARVADMIITMVPDTADVEKVLFGPDGVAEGLSPGKLVIDMSTISPVATRDFAARIGDLGCAYLDAPVSGGDIGAEAGTLSIMVGGEAAAVERAQVLFDILGKTLTHVGETGSGQACKMANQIVVALNIEAVAEALLLAKKAGADPVKVRQALLGGFASSRVLEVHGERMLNRTFTPGFRVDLHRKDLGIALQTAHELGVPLPNTAACQQLFNACMGQGGAAWDDSAMLRTLEWLAGFEL